MSTATIDNITSKTLFFDRFFLQRKNEKRMVNSLSIDKSKAKLGLEV
jgi:hypothetical protein